MRDNENQQLLHGVSGLAQSLHSLLGLLEKANEQRIKTDEEIINLLKLISRKH